jgi:hypothetical protein
MVACRAIGSHHWLWQEGFAVTVTTTGCYSDGKSWDSETSASAELKATVHAEKSVYLTILAAAGKGTKGKAKKDLKNTVFFFSQNAFPCSDCKDYFIEQSRSRNFIFLCTDDQGNYAKDWGLTAPPVPQAIFLRGGNTFFPGKVTSTVTTKAPAPGAGVNSRWVSTTSTVTTMNAINPASCTRPAGFPDCPPFPT